jgi:hypothetical protein
MTDSDHYLRPSSAAPTTTEGMVSRGAAHPLVASRRASPASPSANRAAHDKERQRVLRFLRLRGAKAFAEGDAGEARGVAQRSHEGAAGPTRPSSPSSSGASPTRDGDSVPSPSFRTRDTTVLPRCSCTADLFVARTNRGARRPGKTGPCTFAHCTPGRPGKTAGSCKWAAGNSYRRSWPWR